MARNFWMFVISSKDYQVSREMGLTVHGFRSHYRRRTERMEPNDRVLFYVEGLRKWVATATITSRCFHDASPIWAPGSRGDSRPYRVSLRPDILLNEKHHIDALELAPRLEYVKRWAPEDWPLAFLDALHILPQRDYRLIEGEMKRVRQRGGRGRAVMPPRAEGQPQPAPDGGIEAGNGQAVVEEAEAVVEDSR